MRVLFLQNIDALGGVSYVNSSLANKFIEDNIDVYIYSIRTCNNNVIEYNDKIKLKVINTNDEWNFIQGTEIKKAIKKLKFIKATNLYIDRIKYKNKLFNDYNILNEEIYKVNPDIIICSHYELLEALDIKYLKRTIMHHHCNFDEAYNNKSNNKIFNNYKDKIAKFVFLTKNDCEKAINSGFKNSTYIYNAVRFRTDKKVDVKNTKNCIYIGRIEASNKRYPLMVSMFNRAINEYNIKGWNLLIYGNGEVEELKEYIKDMPNIIYKGVSKDVKNDYLNGSINLNTSIYEGFSLALLEAYECGLPTITFNFSDSSNEQINENVGILINKDDTNSYVKNLANLMINDELRIKLANNTSSFIKNFYIEEIVKEWYQLFKGISNK